MKDKKDCHRVPGPYPALHAPPHPAAGLPAIVFNEGAQSWIGNLQHEAARRAVPPRKGHVHYIGGIRHHVQDLAAAGPIGTPECSGRDSLVISRKRNSIQGAMQYNASPFWLSRADRRQETTNTTLVRFE